MVGILVGNELGKNVGVTVGMVEGVPEGMSVGIPVGKTDGCIVGTAVRSTRSALRMADASLLSSSSSLSLPENLPMTARVVMTEITPIRNINQKTSLRALLVLLSSSS